MSILLASKIHYFRAPVTIGPSSVSMQSSWKHVKNRTARQYETDEKLLGLVRIGNWSQNYKSKNMLCTLDWLSYKEDERNQYYIELRCEHIHTVNVSEMPQISEHIHKMINQNGFILKIHHIFQQAHPGEGSDSGTCGNAGKDGVNQSD